MARKVTFTVDDQTVRRLDDAARRLNKPKSEIVREAVADYHDRIGKLSESERVRMLKLFDELVATIPPRPIEDVDREIADIRSARQAGGRRSR